MCCSSFDNPRQHRFWNTNTATMNSSERGDDNWEDPRVGKFVRLRRAESLRS
jgi:hypothetical protein